MKKSTKDYIDKWIDYAISIQLERRDDAEEVKFRIELGEGTESVRTFFRGGGELQARNDGWSRVALPLHGTVIVTPPELGLLKVTRYLVQQLQAREVPYLVCRINVLEAARIPLRSIKPIASKFYGTLFTPSDTVFQARTSVGRFFSGKDSVRLAFFFAGYDRAEMFPSAFLCELPPGSEPVTVDDAYEALKPEAVKLAESTFGRKIKRQGDIFAIPAPSFSPTEAHTKDARILDTNHVGKEVVIEGGLTYARGYLKHRPFRRDPDHKTVRLGRTWHLLAKNTVPVSG